MNLTKQVQKRWITQITKADSIIIPTVALLAVLASVFVRLGKVRPMSVPPPTSPTQRASVRVSKQRIRASVVSNRVPVSVQKTKKEASKRVLVSVPRTRASTSSSLVLAIRASIVIRKHRQAVLLDTTRSAKSVKRPLLPTRSTHRVSAWCTRRSMKILQSLFV